MYVKKNYIAKASEKGVLRYFSETVSSDLLVIQSTVIFHESSVSLICNISWPFWMGGFHHCSSKPGDKFDRFFQHCNCLKERIINSEYEVVDL